MKRSAPLRRLTALRPRQWMKRRPPRRLRREGSDPAYLDRVRKLGCCAAHLSLCVGPIEAHHAGRRGVGQKSSDRQAIALCSLHHRHVTDHTGPFKGWSRAQRRAWHDCWIERTQERLGATPTPSRDGGDR